MINEVVDLIIEGLFSLVVILAHVYWFIWFTQHPASTSQVTNLLSWEAIFITLFMGWKQKQHHRHIKDLIKQGKTIG